MSTGVSKIVAERNQRILLELVLKPGNDICADCKARAPRWASYNLGIFICMNCASIHRRIGTHITKVKSITLDQWGKEQVEVMKEKGNIKSNALYNPNEARHPPPTNMIDSERDSELERFIRSKYEFKRFMDRKSSSTASTTPRPRSILVTGIVPSERASSPGPLPPPKTPENLPPGFHYSATMPSLLRSDPLPTRSVSQPLPTLTNSEKLMTAPPLKPPTAMPSTIQKSTGKVWEDLVSLQEPCQSSSLPLQFSPMDSTTPFPSQPVLQQQPTMSGRALNPFLKLSPGQDNVTTPLVASPVSISTPSPQFPFVSFTPLSSPTVHLSATNPFSQASLLSSPAVGVNSTAFATSPNPFTPSPMSVSMSMSMSTPTTPSVPSVMALPTVAPLHTPPLPFVPSQTFTTTPAMSLPSTPFAASPASLPMTAGLAQNSFTPVISTLGQTPLSASEMTNPFAAMQMGQGGYLGTSPPHGTPVGTTAFLGPPETQSLHSQQQQQQRRLTHEFGGWMVPSAQGTF